MNGVKLEKKTLVFSQDGDQCQDEPDTSQEITIETENGGDGDFYVIKTDRWAFDKIDDMVKLLKLLSAKEDK